MSDARPARDRGADRRRAVLVLLMFAAAAALDYVADVRGAGVRAPYVGAHVCAFIFTAIQALAGWLSTAATVTVSYLASALGWLAGRVATFLASSGAMFAKLWEGLRIVWTDVLKPALLWLDKTIRNIHDWLTRTFKPVFQFLDDVRQRIQVFYDRFVRPVTDTIDFLRQLNAVLVALHVHVLDKLDETLAQLRRYIDEPFQWLNAQLVRVQNVIDRIVTLDGFFQRWTLVASLRKHAPLWLSHFWADQVGPVRGHDGSAERTADYPTRDGAGDAAQLGAYFDAGAGPRAPVINELALMLMQSAEAPPATPELAP